MMQENSERYAVMVARGDLAVEMMPEDLPQAQEEIIAKCKEKGAPVIVATGLLESMQYGEFPSRAEVNDVYNAIRQGADALMLSGETSNGVNPANAVHTLRYMIDRYSR
jgi:pyruvate kinase